MDIFQRFLGPFVLFALLGLAWKLTTKKESKEEPLEANGKNSLEQKIKITIETVDENEKPSFGIYEEGYEERMRLFLEEQAKCTLDLFKGIDQKTKDAVIKKLSECPVFSHVNTKYQKEVFALFEGKDFVWEEYEYLKKLKEEIGLSSHMAERFCKRETPYNIVKLLIWTVQARAYDAEHIYKLQGVFEWSKILVDYENDRDIYRIVKNREIPWKLQTHPLLPGIMCIRTPVCDFELDEQKQELCIGGKFEFLEKVD